MAPTANLDQKDKQFVAKVSGAGKGHLGNRGTGQGAQLLVWPLRGLDKAQRGSLGWIPAVDPGALRGHQQGWSGKRSQEQGRSPERGALVCGHGLGLSQHLTLGPQRWAGS